MLSLILLLLVQMKKLIKNEVATLIEDFKISTDDNVFLSENNSDTNLNLIFNLRTLLIKKLQMNLCRK